MVHTDIDDEIRQRLERRAAYEGCSVNELLARLLDTPAGAEPPAPDLPYQQMLENTTDVVSLFDLNLRYVYINPVIGKLTGIDPSNMIGMTDAELGMPADKVRFWRQAWDRVIETRAEQIIVFDFMTPQGNRIYESRLTPILDDRDTVRYLMAITRDVTERHRTQEMLRDIANRLPGMILSYRLKPDGTDEVPFVSEGIWDLYQITAEEAYADISQIWAKVHPDDLPGFATSIQESAAYLSLWDYNWRIRMNDGSVKWVSGRGTPRRLEDGSTLWNTVLLDITDRRRLEQQERELLEQLELAISTAQLGVWRLDIASGVLEWNDQLLMIYGITREAFERNLDGWQQQVHPEDREYANTRLNAVFTEGYVFNVNFRIIRPDGEVRYLSASANTIRDAAGHIIALIGVNMDITLIRQNEIALQQSNEMLESIVEHIPVMISFFDENGHFRFVNQHWVDRLGWTVEELVTQADPLAVFYPDPVYREQVREYMLSAAPGWRDFKTHVKNGEIIETSWANVRLSNGRGIGIGQDITDRKRAEQIALEKERLQANLKLEKEHLASIQRLVAKLAHDLRTPLSVISTSRDILTHYFDRIDPDQRRERLETIGNQLMYVTELLNDLNLVRDYAVDTRMLQLMPTNLPILCQIALQDIQDSVGKHHRFTFINRLGVDMLMVDTMLLNRILLNLLSNAVKYSPADSEVRLALSSRDGQVVIQITDEGIGISQDDQAQIFEPFFRSASVESRVEGLGLGLSIVKECVERHNGHIEVESAPGHGTTFFVYLPLIMATAPMAMNN
jgi:PAS domain S-box-containing protein